MKATNNYFLVIYSGGMWLVCGEYDTKHQANEALLLAKQSQPEKPFKAISKDKLKQGAMSGFIFSCFDNS